VRVKRVLLFFIVISLLLPAGVFAGGNPEKGLPKVDRLIRNYNEAILELTVYMKENPEDFDGAQRRIRRIIDLRNTYNSKGLDLLSVLSNEPTNDQKKLEMISYMESLEKNPNQATLDFILGTKAAAQFTYYRAKFDEIMTAGDAMIDMGLYADASRKFTEGFVFYKQEFDEETEEALLARVNAGLGTINSSIISFSELQLPFTASIEACRAALAAGDLALAETAFLQLDSEMLRFSRLRNLVAESGWFLEDTFANIQKTNELVTENSFLPFAYRFSLGRKTAKRYEGVLGAFDAQWNAALSLINGDTDNIIRSQWLSAYSALEKGDAPSGLLLLEKTRRFAGLGAAFSTSASRFISRPDTYGIPDYKATVGRYTAYQALVSNFISLGNKYTAYRDLKRRIEAYVGETPGSVYIRKAPSLTVSSYAGFASELNIFIVDIARERDSLTVPSSLTVYSNELDSFRQAFSSALAADQIAIFRKTASFQENSVVLMLTEWQRVSAESSVLLDGEAIPGSAELAYYPAESIAEYNRLRSGITSDKKAVSEAVALMKKAPPTIVADAPYALSVSNMENVLAGLDALYAEAGLRIAKANSRILQANLARQESDLRYAQSQSALKKGDFQGARDNLQRSREKINLSLSLQESAALRAASDLKIEKLGLEITRQENESVVREVRALIIAGKNLYYLGNFDQAEQIFIQAKNRWSATNIDANPEISNWMEIINTALSMKTGRTIPVSAPLFPQMSQLLSSANQLYIEGKSLMEASKKAAAITVLSTAKEKLQQLQLVYPINQDAGQLTLRINQLIDPPAFELFFKQKVEYVRANYKIERQTAYSDLLDLYQINPGYPGIKKLVDEVEIYLGIQIPPPDPKALARSGELTRSAQKIYDANTRSQFQVALSQLDEAIKLNPNNQVAITLKDRIQTSGGTAQATLVLSGSDEAKYQQAVQELQKGNKITASALVEQLLLNPKNRNSAKIQDLKKRIDSQL
jgi:tetratricopeptide (TPR) repeat protein